MYARHVDEPFSKLREYDSLSPILTEGRPKSLVFPWRKSDPNIELCCFDANEEFLALGWSNGTFSVFERAYKWRTHLLRVGFSKYVYDNVLDLG